MENLSTVIVLWTPSVSLVYDTPNPAGTHDATNAAAIATRARMMFDLLMCLDWFWVGINGRCFNEIRTGWDGVELIQG